MAGTFLEREDERLSVEAATSASVGREKLSSAPFDCVISDYDMPGENGIEFLESVRETHPDIPFILYTGKGSEEIASEAISAGVTDYLQKGTGTDQYTVLTNRVVNAVERWRAELEAEQTRNRLRAITNNSTDVILTIDEESIVQFVNPAISDVLGYEPADVVGESLTKLLPERYREDHHRGIERYVESGERTFHWRNVQFEAPHRDGH
jgi:PAS domain S-box-containing protein